MKFVQRITSSRLFKVGAIGIFGGLPVFTIVATFTLLFYYSAAMPRAPQPENGKIYRIRGPQYGNWVYVDKKELDRWNFLEDYMIPASVAGAFVLFFVGRRLGWLKRSSTVGGDRGP